MKKDIKVGSLKTFINIEGLDPEEKLERKQYVSDIKIDEGEEKTAIFRMTCSETDMDGDIMVPNGINLQRYNKNSPVLWAHQHSALPIGLTTEIANDGNQVISKVKFADTPFAQDVWKLVKMGALKCCSIGFIPLKGFIRGTREFDQYVAEKAIKIAKNTRRIVSEWLLLENSIVNLPCNEDALSLAVSTKSLELSDETIKKLGIELEEEIDLEIIEKPFPNEHAGRQNSPDKYVRFRRRNNASGNGVHFIYGITSDGKTELQSVRFSADKFTAEEARQWLKDHNMNTNLEAATGNKETKIEEKPDLKKIIEEDIKEELEKVETEKVEKKEEEKKEEIPVIVVPKEEPKKEEPDFVILRYGPYVVDEQDVKIAKMIKKGRII